MACLWPSPSLVKLKSVEIISSRARAVACGLLAVASLSDAVVYARCRSHRGLGSWLYLLGEIFTPKVRAPFLLPIAAAVSSSRLSLSLGEKTLQWGGEEIAAP